VAPYHRPVADRSAMFRLALVERLKTQGFVTDERVAAAFSDVPRELFLADHATQYGISAVYRDEAIVTRRDAHGQPLSSSSQPAIMAQMLEMLDVRVGQRVLEVGAGTGYNAALLAHLVGPSGSVTSVELDRQSAAGARESLLAAGADVSVVVGDGRRGMPDGDQVDRIIVTASSEFVPRAWFDQLVPGGILVVPFRLSSVMFALQAVVAFRKVSSGFDAVSVTAGAFMALRGESGGPARAGLAATEMADRTGDRPLVELSGPALAGLSPAERQRLVVTAMGFARARPVDLGRAPSWSLGAYATLALPEERLVEVAGPRWPVMAEHILGVVDAVDGSLAVLAGGGMRARIEAYGGPGAERALAAVVDRWRAAGRPGVAELRLRVRYGPERPHAWRVLRRGDHWVACDWASGRPTDAEVTTPAVRWL
jgi:protein-L-isoaspartate(D-aspartate) O-methyltransferase